MRILPYIALLLGAWCPGLEPAWAGDAPAPQPPSAVARDIEILNRLLQQRQAASSGKTTPPQLSSPPAAAQPAPPARAARPELEPDAAQISTLIAALNDEAKQSRDKALRDLVKIGGPAVPELLLALENPEMRVQLAAAEALGSIRDPRAADPLVELLDSPALDLAGAVMQALARIGPPALPALLEALEKTNSTVRVRAVRLLGASRDPGAAEPLIGLLNKDRSTGVRVEIATALGKIKDRAACDALLDALHDW